MTGLLDRYAARKRKRQVSSNSDSNPTQATRSSLPTAKGGLEMQAIIIPGSLEPGTTDHMEPAGVARTDSKEADSVLSALQEIHPSDEGRPGRLKFMRSGLPRLPLPERIITNSYTPPRGPEPLRVEVSAPGADEVKFIMCCWEPFHRGEATVEWMNNLYLHKLRMVVAARGLSLGEDYMVSVPVGTRKEDIEWNINDGIQVRNCNYVQSTEQVR